MKKAAVANILFFLCISAASIAQIPEKHSAVQVSRARSLVKKFQEDCQWHPSSFIIKAYDKNENGIGNYLVNICARRNNTYLHVYFGEKASGDENGKNEQVLVVTGAMLVDNHNTGRPFLVHDQQFSNLWATTMSEPKCCLPFDCDFDWSDSYHRGGCRLNDCSTGMIGTKMATEYIKNFQRADCNAVLPRRIINEAESFIISATDIRGYLCRNPQVQYLQFYLGYKPFANELTLFVVGLDNTGHHVWDHDDQTTPYLFGNAVACPKCTIEYDEEIDYKRQGGKHYDID